MSDRHHRSKFNQLIQQVIDESVIDVVTELKLPVTVAQAGVEIVIAKLQKIAGGELIYIATSYLWHITGRDRLIYSRFNGHNYHEVAQEFKITTRRIRDIIDKVGIEEFSKKQGQLF